MHLRILPEELICIHQIANYWRFFFIVMAHGDSQIEWKSQYPEMYKSVDYISKEIRMQFSGRYSARCSRRIIIITLYNIVAVAAVTQSIDRVLVIRYPARLFLSAVVASALSRLDNLSFVWQPLSDTEASRSRIVTGQQAREMTTPELSLACSPRHPTAQGNRDSYEEQSKTLKSCRSSVWWHDRRQSSSLLLRHRLRQVWRFYTPFFCVIQNPIVKIV